MSWSQWILQAMVNMEFRVMHEKQRCRANQRGGEAIGCRIEKARLVHQGRRTYVWDSMSCDVESTVTINIDAWLFTKYLCIERYLKNTKMRKPKKRGGANEKRWHEPKEKEATLINQPDRKKMDGSEREGATGQKSGHSSGRASRWTRRGKRLTLSVQRNPNNKD